MPLKYEPWGENPELEWDEINEEKFWFHRISCFEVHECFWHEHWTALHPRASSDPEKYSDRYLIRGITDAGRKLFIVVQHKGANLVRPITGKDDD